MKKILVLLFFGFIILTPFISKAADIRLQTELKYVNQTDGSKFYDVYIAFDQLPGYKSYTIKRNGVDVTDKLGTSACAPHSDQGNYILCYDWYAQPGVNKYDVTVYDKDKKVLGQGTSSVTMPSDSSNPAGPAGSNNNNNANVGNGTETEFGTQTTLGGYLSAVMTWIVTILGSIATLMIIWAGFLYMTSQGNPESISRAKDILIGVISGVVLMFMVEVIAVRTLGLNFTFTVTPAQTTNSSSGSGSGSGNGGGIGPMTDPNGGGGGATNGGGAGGGGGGGGAD